MTCKWLITMVNKSPRPGVVNPLQMAFFMAYKWEYILTTYVRHGMILQVGSRVSSKNPNKDRLVVKFIIQINQI